MSYVGSSIGNIRIEARLGTGGMGEVYLGYDPRLERKVAVKTIRPEKRLSPQLKARFLREARLLSKLGHPAICQVYDLIETPEADFLVLEYVQGMTLRALAERKSLTFERKLRLAEKIAGALAAAHREKIVHRDLKADNIMVTPEDEVKVLDFGIARSTSDPLTELELPPLLPDPFAPAPEDEGSTVELGPAGSRAATDDKAPLTSLGMVVGTLHAMSPEQVAGGSAVTEASDLYSFGILLHELFTEAPAYETQEELELLALVQRAQTRPITGLDADLVRLIHDLESLDPRRRPTAEEAAERLRWVLDKPQRQRRQRRRAAALAATFVFLLLVLVVVSWLAIRAERARREADQRRKQAESLIAFMVGDLRAKLEAVNRLEVLDAAGDRALAYFAAVPESQLTDAELAYRIHAILQIGDVRYTQGNLPAALKAFRLSQTLAQHLVARDPTQEDWQAALGQTHAWIGQIYYDQRQTEEALAAWQEHLRQTQEQARLHPRSPRWHISLAQANHNLGTVLELRGDLAGALRCYRESLAFHRTLPAARRDDFDSQSRAAATLAFVSNLLERQGDLAGALAERREYVRIHERIVARNPNDSVRRMDLATARGFLAGLLVTLGDRASARPLYENGLAEVERLATQDPENAILQRWLAALASALGVLETAEGDPTQAVDLFSQARRAMEPLVARDPENPDWRLQLGLARSRAASTLALLDLSRARSEARTAVEILTPLLQSEPDDPTRGNIAEAEVVLGRIEAALGNHDGAREAWQRALAVLAPCARPMTHWKVLSPWAQALLSLDRAEEARPAVERLERMGYRNPALEKLYRKQRPAS